MKIKEMDELVFLWNEYAKEHDSKMTPGAILLKVKVRKFVKSLPTFPEISGGV